MYNQPHVNVSIITVLQITAVRHCRNVGAGPPTMPPCQCLRNIKDLIDLQSLTHSLANKSTKQCSSFHLRLKSTTGSSFFTGVYPVLL